ncbi:MAG: DNA-3-methyladenine glycosylase 2 family protein, partial [Actinomycetota bacterium]
MPTRTIAPPFPVDFRLTLGPTRRGRSDPCTRIDARSVWRATRTPEGPATLHLTASAGRVVAQAWGQGAAWALEH